jgi:hypothetical protein
MVARQTWRLDGEMSYSDTEWREPMQPNEEPRTGEIRTYDRWQLFYLDRLHRLYALNKDADAGLLDEEEVRILRRAIFSTLLDCEDVGVGDEARQAISVED